MSACKWMQMSEMGIVTEADPVREADPWPCLISEEQGAINKQTYGSEVHAKLHLVPNRLQNNHKPFQAKCFSCCGAFGLPAQPLQKIHQDCTIKLPRHHREPIARVEIMHRRLLLRGIYRCHKQVFFFCDHSNFYYPEYSFVCLFVVHGKINGWPSAPIVFFV